jgi:hypothetical protein
MQLDAQTTAPASSTSSAEFVSGPLRDQIADELDRHPQGAQYEHGDERNRDRSQQPGAAGDLAGIADDQHDEQRDLDRGDQPTRAQSQVRGQEDGEDHRGDHRPDHRPARIGRDLLISIGSGLVGHRDY